MHISQCSVQNLTKQNVLLTTLLKVCYYLLCLYVLELSNNMILSFIAILKCRGNEN